MKHALIRFFALVLVLCIARLVLAQAVVVPTGSSGSAYPVFTAAGFGIEGPDNSSPQCAATPGSDAGNHRDFGAHVVQQADTALGQNVFAFISHLDDDSDRCLVYDRVRMEIKGGPNGNSDPELEHQYGDTSHYRWQFRLDDDFVGTGSFCHLFQNKAQGGSNGSFPVVTLTARRTVLELIHSPIDNSGSSEDLAEVSLDVLRGKWVEVYMRQVHTDTGLLEVRIDDIATGTPLLRYLNEDIDLWRETPSPSFINRPKWGIYRRISTDLRDETVLFAGFCSSESSEALCPSLLPAAGGAPLPVSNAVPLDEAEHVPTSMPLMWRSSAGATSYNVYFSSDPTQLTETAVTDTTLAVALTSDETYYYQIGAVNADGESRTAVYSFRTLTAPDGDGWEVARGHTSPHVEAADFFELNTNLADPPAISQTIAVADEAGNRSYHWFSGPKEGSNGNYRWRYRQEEGEVTTAVLRIAPLPGVNNIAFVEFYGLGWRQKLRINRSNIKFERTPGDPETDFPDDYWKDGEYRLLRFTFQPSGDTNMLTSLYLDEATDVFAAGLSDEAKTSNYLEIGRAGSTNYGCSIDYFAINPTGAFAPDSTTAPQLPADLFGGGGGAAGTPVAATQLLPIDGVSDVPLYMPLAWTTSDVATSYNVYFGTGPNPAFLGDTTATVYPVPLAAATTYYYQIGAVNTNGETLSPVQQFTTLANPNDGSWNIARGHARPEIEAAQFFEFDTNLSDPPDLDSIIAIDTLNAAYGYLSGAKENGNGNYRWRYRQNDNDEVTLVLRVRPLVDISNLLYVDFYGLGWRQKIRLNRSTAKFERTPDDPEFAFPAGFWDVDSFRVLRFTFELDGSGNLLTRLYLNESEDVFCEGGSDEDTGNSFLDVGRAGGENYGLYFDYIAINPSGAFAPDADANPPLPSDLIAPRTMSSSLDASPAIHSLLVYPNPVGNQLFLASASDPGSTYTIANAAGQVLLHGILNTGHSISTEALPPGTYVVTLQEARGQRAIGRFVKL